MAKLLQTKEIAELYGVTPTTITNNWCNKGLKFIRSKNSFLFKIDWIEEYLEKQALENTSNKNQKQNRTSISKNLKPMTRTRFNYSEMKIV